MSTSTSSFRRTAFAAAAMIGCAISASASAQPLGGVIVASGDLDGDGAAARSGEKVWDVKENRAGVTDTNWFNPENWTPYGVPGPNDTVYLDGADRVVIDPAKNPAGSSKVTFGDLVISSVAVLETLPGTIVENGGTVVLDQGQLIHRGSGALGQSLVADGTVVLNPTSQSKRTYVLKSSATLDIGMGGTQPAALIKTGPGTLRLDAGAGHYATLETDTLVIEGELKLSTYYGFSPRPGQTFQLITVNGSRSGRFIGVPEGGYVGCTQDNVGLRMSYQGGDGNDLVLSAEATDPVTCLLLPAVQKVREAASATGDTAARMLNNKNPELTR